ncbi:MAG TPA: hypothetical protein VEA99_16425 [Gemmatimonadaceae bacterium]|nr:hypothetical protein [Gemmatimonadaceae bacterium]
MRPPRTPWMPARRARRLLALAVATAFAPVASLLAQSPGDRRLEPAAARAVEALADSARAAALPVEALQAKVAEGLLKGAPDARIVSAVRTLSHELRDAQRALGAGASAGELVAGATAIHAGVPLARLQQLRGAAPARAHGTLVLPIVVLVDLVTRRVPAEVATRSVETLLARGASDAELQALRVTVEQDILAGRAPADAAAARTRAIVERLGGRLDATRLP